MNIEQLKERVLDALRSELPKVVVRISPLSENLGDLGVSVYAVEKKSVRLAKDIILNLDCELCIGTTFSLTPMVRDIETTTKHYPQFLPVWTSAVSPGVCAAVDLPPVAMVEIVELNHAEWVPAASPDLCAMAANEELALAA